MKRNEKRKITLKLNSKEASILLGAIENVSQEFYSNLCGDCYKKLENTGEKLAAALLEKFNFVNTKELELPFEVVEQKEKFNL